jgi:hypothetical protein
MTATNTDRWQAAMDAAFDRWQANGDWTWADLVDSCGRREWIAVLAGKLHQQVQNGGLSQWAFNGYGKTWRLCVAALRRVGGPLAAEVAARLERVAATERGNGRRRRAGEAFDEWYYAHADGIEAEVDAFFARPE